MEAVPRCQQGTGGAATARRIPRLRRGIPSVLATRPFPACAASDSRLWINAGPTFPFEVFANWDWPVHAQSLRGACLVGTALYSPLPTGAGRFSTKSPLRRTKPAGAVLAHTGDDRLRFRPPGGDALQVPEFGIPVRGSYHVPMDRDKVDEAVLALLYLGIHERYRGIPGARAWKSLDWDAMERLHGKGLISEPATKARSVMLTEAGLREAETACRQLFDAEDDEVR